MVFFHKSKFKLKQGDVTMKSMSIDFLCEFIDAKLIENYIKV